MVWYAHLFQNFPQCIVIHTVKGFGIVNKAEIRVSLTPAEGSHSPSAVVANRAQAEAEASTQQVRGHREGWAIELRP